MVAGKDSLTKRKLRYGMVGGGRDAFIGAVHRKAAALDGEIEFVAGALSSNPKKAKASGHCTGQQKRLGRRFQTQLSRI